MLWFPVQRLSWWFSISFRNRVNSAYLLGGN
jgi:hypothetical protein